MIILILVILGSIVFTALGLIVHPLYILLIIPLCIILGVIEKENSFDDLVLNSILVFLLSGFIMIIIAVSISYFSKDSSTSETNTSYVISLTTDEKIIIESKNGTELIDDQRLYWKCKSTKCTTHIETVTRTQPQILSNSWERVQREYDVQ